MVEKLLSTSLAVLTSFSNLPKEEVTVKFYDEPVKIKVEDNESLPVSSEQVQIVIRVGEYP